MNVRLKSVQKRLAPQLEKQHKRRRTVVIVLIWVAVVFAAALFEIKPALREISFWRARRYAAKAEVDLAAENWSAAQTKALMAYQIQPEEPAAVRAVARLQSLTGGSAGALQFWEILKASGKLNAADRRMQAEDLLRSGMLPEARKEVERLLAEAPNDPLNLRVAAKWAATEKNSEAAINFASRAQAVEPNHLPGRLLLGLLQSEAPAAAVKKAGLQNLLQLADDRGRTGLEALIFLATRKELPPENRSLVIDRLRAHPLASESHRLIALDLELAQKPEQRDAVLDAAVEQYRKADPAAQRTFAVWLNSRKEFDRTLAFLPISEAMKRKDFLLVTLDAMAQQKRWTEIEEILQGKAVPLDEVYTELFLARSSMELGRQSSADLHWRRAHIAASASIEQMKFLASYAEKIGQTDHAELAYRSLTNSAATARDAYESLLRLAEKRRDSAALHDLLGEMVKRWPKDSSVRNDYTYFTLLRGEDLVDGLKTARELVAEAPTSLAHRTTLALANLRLNDPAAASAVYDGLNVPWDRAPSSHRAVYAAVLGAAGKVEEARRQAAAIPADSLRPEERELIAPWRAP
jgi:hypothetical protein